MLVYNSITLSLTTRHIMNCDKSYVMVCDPSIAHVSMYDRTTSKKNFFFEQLFFYYITYIWDGGTITGIYKINLITTWYVRYLW